MKHNVNYILLGLVLMVLVSMIGLVIYYYVTFEGLRSKYNLALEDLSNVSYQMNQTSIELRTKERMLDEKERILLNYLGELNISRQRVDSIEDHFLREQEKAQLLETNLGSTQSERDRYASLYNKYYEESQQYQRRYEQTKTQLDSAESRIVAARLESQQISSQMELELSAILSELSRIRTVSRQITGSNNLTSAKSLAQDIDEHAEKSQTGMSALNGYVSRIRRMLA
jgi:chromosome segregation ATPase